MGTVRVNGNTFSAQGEIGYDFAGEFASKCARFIERHRGVPAVLDLTAARELVSPCLTAVYEECRLHRPAELTVVVRAHIAKLFEPGAMEKLYRLEVV